MTAPIAGELSPPAWAGLLRPGYAHIQDPNYTSVDVGRCGAVLRPIEPGEPLIRCDACYGGATWQ